MYPKQFIRFFGDEQPSFLGTALLRFAGQSDFADPILIANNDHRFLVRAECEAAGVTPKQIVLEPVARNTAPAIAAAACLLSGDPDAILCVMPSDHVIGHRETFLSAVRQAAGVALERRLVLSGSRRPKPTPVMAISSKARRSAAPPRAAWRASRRSRTPLLPKPI